MTTVTDKLLTGGRRQKAVIEFNNAGWMLMHDNGDIEEWDTPAYALASVQRRANRGNKTVTITTIEWRNVPDGFKPPTGDQTGLLKRKRKG